MKIYMVTDIEGVAGVVSHDSQSNPDGRYYDRARKLLTQEINAAVEGLLEGGATEILVLDGHGPGAVDYEDLHAKARLLHGRPITAEQMVRPIAEHDAVVFVGQHARHGVAEGNQNHTFNSRTIDWVRLNDQPIGEIAWVALWAGLVNVPVIALTGDRAACEEAAGLIPRIQTVEVKVGVAKNAAISLSVAEARLRIRHGMAAAVRHHRQEPIAPLRLEPPYVRTQRYFKTDDADLAQNNMGAKRLDAQTVQWTSPDLRDVLIGRAGHCQ